MIIKKDAFILVNTTKKSIPRGIDMLTNKWWLRMESNHRHRDFQSLALPTELQSQKNGGPDENRTRDLLRDRQT